MSFDLANFAQAVSDTIKAAAWAIKFTNGSDTLTFSTDSGPKISFAKAIKDFQDEGDLNIQTFETHSHDSIDDFSTASSSALSTFTTNSGSAITSFNASGTAAIAAFNASGSAALASLQTSINGITTGTNVMLKNAANIITADQTNSARFLSSAALGTDPTQLPNQAQVRGIAAPAYVEPLVDWHFGAWSGTGALASRGLKSGSDLTFTGTPTEVESVNGLARQFTNTQSAVANSTGSNFFNRIHQGLPFTLVIEGNNLLPNTGAGGQEVVLFGNADMFVLTTGFQIRYHHTVANGRWWPVLRNGNTFGNIPVIDNINSAGYASLVRIVLSGSLIGYKAVFTLADGTIITLNGATPTIVANTALAQDLVHCNYNKPSNSFFGAATLHRIRLYDRILDI